MWRKQQLCSSWIRSRYIGRRSSFYLPSETKINQEMKRNAECLQNQDTLAASVLQGTPFDNLRLTSQAILESAQKQGRSKCPRCHGSRMFYCYSCYVPVETVPVEDIPIVKLPLKIDIIKHPNETDGKSTAVHAKLLASEDVTIYTYPCIPNYEEMQHEIALIFPGPNSVSISNIPLSLQAKCKTDTKDLSAEPAPKCAKLEPSHSSIPSEDNLPKSENALKKIVFIDSTWNQTTKIITDERLQGLLQIELKSKKTCFWRHQKGKPETYLSTIEAIYYFLVDYHKEVLKEKYDGQYDNLLFFFSFMYKLIKKAKDSAGKK